MKQFAVIDRGAVVNIIIAPDGFAIEGLDLVEYAPPAHIGGTYENGVFSAPPQPPQPAPEPPPRASVAKSLVMERVSAAGKMGDAYAMLTKNPDYFGKWFAPDRPVVYCDDPLAMKMVSALGLDPAVILAPA